MFVRSKTRILRTLRLPLFSFFPFFFLFSTFFLYSVDILLSKTCFCPKFFGTFFNIGKLEHEFSYLQALGGLRVLAPLALRLMADSCEIVREMGAAALRNLVPLMTLRAVWLSLYT